jgi:UPF0755 protein
VFAAPPAARRHAEPPPEGDPDHGEALPARTLTTVRDRPAAPRRVPAGRRTPPPRRPVRPASARPHRPWGRRVVALLALVVLAVVLYLVNAVFQPFHGDGSGAVALQIPEGANAGSIGDLLAGKGVIDSATFFQVNATLTGRRGDLHPGRYTLARNMSNGAVLAALTQGPKAKPPAKTVDVTLPEGPSIREMAPVVDKSGKVEGAYLRAASSPRVLKQVRRLGAPRRARTAEGFMFPATYRLLAGSPARKLVDQQLKAFRDNLAGVDMRYAKRKNLTRYDVLIIASMVEREAMLDRERPLVAAVIYNRLKAGMPLGIDATIRYDTHNWSRPIRQSELDRPSPYNTRRNQGLPPTPIGNPGLASIKAAADPSRKDYLFYVVKPGTCGEHAFSSTDAQFSADLQKYNDARADAGGKSPTSC